MVGDADTHMTAPPWYSIAFETVNPSSTESFPSPVAEKKPPVPANVPQSIVQIYGVVAVHWTVMALPLKSMSQLPAPL